MKKKNKIILYVIAVVCILLVGGVAGGFVGNEIGKKDSTCSTSTTTNNYIEGTCEDGGRYKCTTTCVDIPSVRPRETPSLPTDGITCRTYSSDNKYSASAWDTSLDSLAGCQNYALNHGCSAPTQINIVNHCCVWSC